MITYNSPLRITMKQKVTTPEILPCVCGAMPVVMPAVTGWDHFERHYMVECKKCTRRWPRNASTKHRAICKWNNRMISLENMGDI